MKSNRNIFLKIFIILIFFYLNIFSKFYDLDLSNLENDLEKAIRDQKDFLSAQHPKAVCGSHWGGKNHQAQCPIVPKICPWIDAVFLGL